MSMHRSSPVNLGVADGRWDRAGMALSALCVAHCLVSPLLFGLLPVLAMAESEIHLGLMVLLLVIGLLAFVPGRRLHGSLLPALMAVGGFAMLSELVPLHTYVSDESGESLSTLAGGAMLIAAHLTNFQFCRRCRFCHGEPCRPFMRSPQG